MLLLALDSTAVAASVCLMEDGVILAESYQNTKQTHSQTLMPMVQFVLQCARRRVDDLDLLAVSAGPGSFTGVRIGISCVKGLAFPKNIPCCGVSVLQAMAENLAHMDAVVCAVMDARCRQVYQAFFRVKNGEVTRLCEDRAITLTQLREDLEKQGGSFVLVGDGAKLVHAGAGTCGPFVAAGTGTVAHAAGPVGWPWPPLKPSKKGKRFRPKNFCRCICACRRHSGN